MKLGSAIKKVYCGVRGENSTAVAMKGVEFVFVPRDYGQHLSRAIRLHRLSELMNFAAVLMRLGSAARMSLNWTARGCCAKHS